ncbi:hypothetical protein GCM10009818_12540 [Nakamurella flavida]
MIARTSLARARSTDTPAPVGAGECEGAGCATSFTPTTLGADRDPSRTGPARPGGRDHVTPGPWRSVGRGGGD